MLKVKALSTFIGAKDYNTSKAFYLNLGFKDIEISSELSYFTINNIGFYLQDYYVKDWIDNSMIFIKVEDIKQNRKAAKNLNLEEKFKNVRVSEIEYNNWGNVFFIHDPSGVLLHTGEFK